MMFRSALTLFTGRDIICIAPGYWQESWLDVHRYMTLLAEKNRVLFVERPVTPFSIVAPGQRNHARSQWRNTLRKQPHTVALDGNLQILAPLPILPLRYENPVLRFNQYLRKYSIKSILSFMTMRNIILWIYDPDTAPLIGAFNESVSLYCITDDYASNPASLNRASQVRKWDNRLAQHADLVITTEPELASRKKHLNANTHFIPHGVEHDLFARTLHSAQSIAPEIAHLSTPVIGFVGRINYRIDLQLIHVIREKHPDWTLLFVGSIGEDDTATQLSNMPDIILTGQKSVAELPAYLKKMDVCLIPYIINDHTRTMHPLKALEYLAAGRPVVSTSLPALQHHASMINFADTPDDFVNAIETALNTDSRVLQQKRSAYTVDKTCSARLDDICALIDATIQQKNRP